MDLLLDDNVTSTNPGEVAGQFGTDLHHFGDVWPPHGMT